MNSHSDTNITPDETVEDEIDFEMEEFDLHRSEYEDTAFYFYVRPLEGEHAKDNAAFEAERNQALNNLKEYIASRIDDDGYDIHAESLAYDAFDRTVSEFKEFTAQNPDVLTEFGVAYANSFNKPDSPTGNIVLAQSKNGEITYNNKYGIDDSLSDKGVITEFAVDKLKMELESVTVKQQTQEHFEKAMQLYSKHLSTSLSASLDSLKRAMQLINEYCEAEFEGEADFSDLSKVDLAYTTDAETEVPIQVYADLENFRLVKEYDGKIASEEQFDSLDDLSDKVLSNLEFDDLVAFYFAAPAEQQIGQEQKSPENTDILKALGIEDSRIAFTDVTLDNDVSFITGSPVDESNIENEEQFLDYAVENIGKTIEVRADRYVLGGADVEAQNATPEQANYIQANRSEVMKQASHMQESHMQDSKVFAVAVSEADREKLMARKAEILETSARNQDKFISSIENSGRLLPFLNANRDFHSARLKTLNQKNATRTDKIERNEAKIERLTARVEKLQAANEMLGSIFGTKAAPIRALIDRNNARIEKIQTKKIPKRENKINKQLGKIERGNRKIEREQCKVDKLENLSKAIGSFGILNGQERRQQFAQAMDGLRDASMRSVQFKIEKCSDRIAALSEKYQSASASDRLNIAEKLKKQIEKKNGLVHKGDVLYAHERAFKPFEQQTQAVIDGVMDTAKNECAKYEQALESGADSTSLDTFAENISVSACEKAINIESERVEAAVKASIKPDTFLDESEKPAAEKNNAEKAKKTDKAARGKRPDIIGSVKYSEIEDKVYLKMSAAEAQEKAELLKGSGVRYSGRIYEDGKATLTVEKADVPKLREVTERKPSVLGEIGKIKAEQKDAPKKEKPAKNLQEEL